MTRSALKHKAERARVLTVAHSLNKVLEGLRELARLETERRSSAEMEKIIQMQLNWTFLHTHTHSYLHNLG